MWNAIHEVSETSSNRNLPDDTGHFQTRLTPTQWAKVASLVGKKCVVKCFLDENEVQALWNTGSQVLIVSESLLREKFPDKCVKHISELIDAELNLTAGNGGEIPYSGWLELDFKLSSNKESLTVPFLVTKHPMDLL